jgi:hypothetical protein
MPDLYYVTLETKLIIARQTIVGYWIPNNEIRRNIGFSDFVHRPDFSKYQWKNTTFRKLDLFPSSGVFPHLRTETDPVSDTLCFFIGI